MEDMMKTASAVIDLLGGGRVLGSRVSTDKELVISLQQGLPFRALEALKRRLRLSDSELAQAIDIHPRTLARRKSQKRLRSDESDRLSRLARVTSHAIDVLGSQENAIAWLRNPNRALGGVPPLQYLSTDLGARRVEAALSHIEWGDLS
jgi:putative toxin-antitoxin system antitoxin component (TIGR02293 family)